MPGELQIPLWDWWIVWYFFVGGIAGGAYFTSAIIELVGGPEDRPVARMGYYIAFPLSLLCALFLILDLGLPERFWHMMVYSRTFLPWPVWDSPISVGAYALLGFGLFSFISFMDALVETGRLPWAPLRLRYNSTPRLIYSIIGALFGFFLASYTGVLLSTTHLPLWTSTPLLGALFLASGASTGMAAIALGLVLTRSSAMSTVAWDKLRQADTVAIIVEIVLLVAFIAMLYASGQALSALDLILLIGGTLVVGLVAPLVMQFRAGAHTARAAFGMTPLIALLILIGGFVMRMAIVMGGQGLL
ncbi:MAG: NrfD/PsrC family molybdoenzyme membrane anchor subunit [Anaerolineales bacterium]